MGKDEFDNNKVNTNNSVKDEFNNSSFTNDKYKEFSDGNDVDLALYSDQNLKSLAEEQRKEINKRTVTQLITTGVVAGAAVLGITTGIIPLFQEESTPSLTANVTEYAFENNSYMHFAVSFSNYNSESIYLTYEDSATNENGYTIFDFSEEFDPTGGISSNAGIVSNNQSQIFTPRISKEQDTFYVSIGFDISTSYDAAIRNELKSFDYTVSILTKKEDGSTNQMLFNKIETISVPEPSANVSNILIDEIGGIFEFDVSLSYVSNSDELFAYYYNDATEIEACRGYLNINPTPQEEMITISNKGGDTYHITFDMDISTSRQVARGKGMTDFNFAIILFLNYGSGTKESNLFNYGINLSIE